MTKFFVTCAAFTIGPDSVNIAPSTISPDYPRLEAAQQKALELSGLPESEAYWWRDETELYHELHRENGSWTGYAVRTIQN